MNINYTICLLMFFCHEIVIHFKLYKGIIKQLRNGAYIIFGIEGLAWAVSTMHLHLVY